MNKTEMDLVKSLYEKPFVNQRLLAEDTGYSLGKVNQSLKELVKDGYLREDFSLTEKAENLIQQQRPRNAIILAAGYGMRMVPINMEMPKGLLQVGGEALIERIIRQLQEVGITDITVVVGFMKESYEYLIDQFGVKLKVNMAYGEKNNLHSLALCFKKLGGTYIVPCDIYCATNPFHREELYSWYMVGQETSKRSTVRINRQGGLAETSDSGNQMIGIAYVTEEDGDTLARNLVVMDEDEEFQNSFWEDAMWKGIPWEAKVCSEEDVFEINTYEQLRSLDDTSESLQTEAMDIIADVFACEMTDINHINVLKKGMTNRSFRFQCKGDTYIMRIPGEGTEKLVNRAQEYQVYQALQGTNICDDVIYMNPDNGYKITRYVENSKNGDPLDWEEVARCVNVLRDFHQRGLQVDHVFDIFREMEFYEALWDGAASVYRDYEQTKAKVYELKEYIDAHHGAYVLSHIDANPDNFLMYQKDGKEEIRLIDWEYAGMQDANVDIAMYIIYAMYEREDAEHFIDIYYPNGCPKETRLLIYCYIAACGLLWSNWCEYKRQLGVEFGEYSLRQYHYAKEYYKVFKEERGKDE